jgi:hypothetical protein
VLEEAAVREAQQLERLAGDRSSGVIGSVPAQPQRRLVLGGDEVLDRDAHVRGLMDGLHNPAEPVQPANLDIAQALVVDVLLGDRRRDGIQIARGQDVDDRASRGRCVVHRLQPTSMSLGQSRGALMRTGYRRRVSRRPCRSVG